MSRPLWWITFPPSPFPLCRQNANDDRFIPAPFALSNDPAAATSIAGNSLKRTILLASPPQRMRVITPTSVRDYFLFNLYSVFPLSPHHHQRTSASSCSRNIPTNPPTPHSFAPKQACYGEGHPSKIFTSVPSGNRKGTVGMLEK